MKVPSEVNREPRQRAMREPRSSHIFRGKRNGKGPEVTESMAYVMAKKSRQHSVRQAECLVCKIQGSTHSQGHRGLTCPLFLRNLT